ncbi:class I SAM-dependent RNA methyltransferase [Sinomonas gamaensis]|uniref:class I SAM-dependent RNA methyltransferase n=1 Tax=Sinomonas gamaensis TaxID=2565624 RepID=UPI001107D468|nr:class I SAM-dependent RNA methyltransferase [Sinomonas gamaensis]
MSDSPTLLELRLGPIAHGGHTVARHEGRVVFVRHGIPGELVRVQLTDAEEGKKFWRADVVEVLEPAPSRRPHVWAPADSPSAYAAGTLPVGGAEFGHIELSEQRRLKAAVVREQLSRLAHVELDVVVEPVPVYGGSSPGDGLHWRTRCSFAVDGEGRLAMHAHRSDTVVPIWDMPLAVEEIEDLGLWDADLSGVERVEVAAPAAGGAPLVIFTLQDGVDSSRLARLVEAVDPRASVSAVGPEGGAPLTLRGRGSVTEEVEGFHYTVTGEGFWQIHRRAAETLMRAALEAVEPVLLKGSVAADLYAGAGLFTAPLAAAVGPSGAVLSVEGAPGTSRDARRTFKRQPQVDVVQGRVERVLRRHAGTRFDAVVLDPPRAGAGREVVRGLVDLAPRAIAYVACDPASFARDLGWFRDGGWTLEWLRAFDLYPQTHHVETVALLRPGS